MLGFKFRRQHQFGEYLADFFCREAGLIIECDGAIHENTEQWQHDRNRDIYMVGQGLRVLRFTNDSVLHSPDEVLNEIAKWLPAKDR